MIYQIYPRSFADSNGDGIGDLPGITSRLDYLSEVLGVDALWLSPHYPSPQDDFGYDVSNYVDVDSIYGNLDDFDELVSEAHARNLKLILDFVPNHSSDRHPWFIESASSTSNPKRDWYVWRDSGADGGPPNNWASLFGGPAWELDPSTKQYYLHTFLVSQPELNWRNPEVEKAMLDAMRFWLDRGVDGFRIDVAGRIMKDPLLRDNPPALAVDAAMRAPNLEWALTEHVYDGYDPDIHATFRRVRRTLDEYDDRFSVGEIHEWDWEKWASYHGRGDELDMVFNFAPLISGIDPDKYRAITNGMESVTRDWGWPNWVAGNHDQPRIATRLGLEASKAMAVMLLTLRGTPTLYYGDELGMVDAEIPPDRQQDPYGRRVPGQGRDGCRTPMQWSSEAHAGFSAPTTASTWLPVPSTFRQHNVQTQQGDPSSHLELYRRLLALRRQEPALHGGDIRVLRSPRQVLAYRRTHPTSQSFLVLANLAEVPARVRNRGTVVLGTDHTVEGTPFSGELAPWEAVVLRTRRR
ncbi:MAG TPA: alpha-amylase family glycosyl hydrolase [Acidimicrobiia bacterium]